MIGRRLAGLLLILGVATLAGFGVAIQNVRIAQAQNDEQVLELTQIVSLSPCSNLSTRACLRKLIQAGEAEDFQPLQELLSLPAPGCKARPC